MPRMMFLPGLILLMLWTFSCTDDSSSQEVGDSENEGIGDIDRDDDEGSTVNLCLHENTDGATSRCLQPTMPAEYYIEQSLKYFDTLDIDAEPKSIPEYSELVARWEWPPWLLLTGFGKETLESTAVILREYDPSTVPKRDCRAFDVQPFGRCYIEFDYGGRSCPIYEEFTFNDEGKMTFIEAWSDLPGMLPMDDEDIWAEDPAVNRLSTRIPGLGNSEGLIDLDGVYMLEAENSDEDVAEFAKRARDQWTYWFEEFQNSDDDLYAIGCGW